MREKQLVKKAFFATLIAGVAAAAINTVIYVTCAQRIPFPLLIAIMFAIFTLAVAMALKIGSSDISNDEFLFLSDSKGIFLGIGVCTLIVFALAAGFEWLYDHEVKKNDEPTSYIFLIDDSGSMSTNDPENRRYEAIDSVLKNMPDDFPYAVYRFSGHTENLRKMLPKSEPWTPPMDFLGGGTMLFGGMNTVYDDLKDKAVDGGENPRLIVLADGDAHDKLHKFGVTNKLKSAGISVSTVGFGNADERQLKYIAERTGGKYVSAENASELGEALKEASAADIAARNLLSDRGAISSDGLYAFLRILFLFLLGTAVAFVKMLACANTEYNIQILIGGGAAALVGALLVEFGIALGLPVPVCQVIMWLLLALTLLFEERIRVNHEKGAKHINVYV